MRQVQQSLRGQFGRIDVTELVDRTGQVADLDAASPRALCELGGNRRALGQIDERVRRDLGIDQCAALVHRPCEGAPGMIDVAARPGGIGRRRPGGGREERGEGEDDEKRTNFHGGFLRSCRQRWGGGSVPAAQVWMVYASAILMVTAS